MILFKYWQKTLNRVENKKKTTTNLQHGRISQNKRLNDYEKKNRFNFYFIASIKKICKHIIYLTPRI